MSICVLLQSQTNWQENYDIYFKFAETNITPACELVCIVTEHASFSFARFMAWLATQFLYSLLNHSLWMMSKQTRIYFME